MENITDAQFRAALVGAMEHVEAELEAIRTAIMGLVPATESIAQNVEAIRKNTAPVVYEKYPERPE